MSDITSDRSGDRTSDQTLHMLEADTLLQSLFDAIENEWSNNAVEVLIRELIKKDYSQSQLLKMIELKFGKIAALNLLRTIARQ